LNKYGFVVLGTNINPFKNALCDRVKLVIAGLMLEAVKQVSQGDPFVHERDRSIGQRGKQFLVLLLNRRPRKKEPKGQAQAWAVGAVRL
jgi:hypothetical protein